MPLPKRVQQRLASGIKKFQPILESAIDRDVNESDTVLIVRDILSDLLGFDPFKDLTAEYAIRGRYVDLAIVKNERPVVLVEVKAIGTELHDRHVRQAVDYAANEGVEWVILTNGQYWRIYKVTFSQPINSELVDEVDMLALNPRSTKDLELLFPITPEGIKKDELSSFYRRKRAVNRFFLGAIIRSTPIVASIRRELRKLEPEVRISDDELRALIEKEVLKREVVEDDQGKEAYRIVKRKQNRRAKNRAKSSNDS